MAVVQEAFYIPDDIATGLVTGLYKRYGGVVRYAMGPNNGQIVKHLKPIDLNALDEAQGVSVKALRFVKQHKKESIFIVAGVAAAGAGAWVYNTIKNREPKVVTEFREAFRVYIDATRQGNMSVGKINNLMKALEELKKHKDYDKINIQLTADDLETMVGRIHEYTIKLARDNRVELSEQELNTIKMKNSGTIINLQNYLKTQKRIFETAV